MIFYVKIECEDITRPMSDHSQFTYYDFTFEAGTRAYADEIKTDLVALVKQQGHPVVHAQVYDRTPQLMTWDEMSNTITTRGPKR